MFDEYNKNRYDNDLSSTCFNSGCTNEVVDYSDWIEYPQDSLYNSFSVVITCLNFIYDCPVVVNLKMDTYKYLSGYICDGDVCINGQGNFCFGTITTTGTTTTGTTMGIPVKWYCLQSQYDDGLNCNCECGAPDPDCSGSPYQSIFGCSLIEHCYEGRCVPDRWTCDDGFYNTMNGCNCVWRF